jgi:hypothetical protein
VYCHCRHDYALPDQTRQGVLEGLCKSEADFEAVDDLCALAARKDPLLQDLAQEEDLRIAACHTRAVRLLFQAGQAPIDGARTVLANMRDQTPEDVLKALLAPGEGDRA